MFYVLSFLYATTTVISIFIWQLNGRRDWQHAFDDSVIVFTTAAAVALCHALTAWRRPPRTETHNCLAG